MFNFVSECAFHADKRRIWTSSRRVAICMLIYIRIRDETNHVLCSLLAPALFTRFDFSAHAVINFPFSIECGTCPSFIYAFNQKAKKAKKTTLVWYSIPIETSSFTPRTALLHLCFLLLLFHLAFSSFLPSFLPHLIYNKFLVGKKFISQHFH